jgi:Tol biopolymer transport system component
VTLIGWAGLKEVAAMKPVLRRLVVVIFVSALGLSAVIALASSLGQAEVDLTRVTYSSEGVSRRSELPSISCDGARIAFTSNSDFHNEGLMSNKYIWLYDAQTTALTRLTPRINSRDFGDEPSISADGTKIAFYSDNDFLDQGIIDGQYEIWLATTSPLTVTRLTTSTSSVFIHNQQPSISADGTKVAFTGNYDFFGGVLLQGSDLWMVDVATKVLTRLVHSVPEGRWSDQPDLSADGTRAVFRSDADFLGEGVPSGSHHIWLYDTLAMTFTHISRDITYGGASEWPSISGDGTRIAFVSSADYLNGGSGASHLWLYDSMVQTYTRVTDHPNWPSGTTLVQRPEISLDGNSILFSSVYDHINEQLGDHQEIWRYDIPSATFSRVTTSTGRPFSGLLVNNLASSTNGNGGVVAFQSNVDFFNEGDTGEYEIWQAIITPTASISPPLTYSNTAYLPLVMRDTGGSVPITWEDDDFDAMSPGQLDGQNGWFKAAPDRTSPVVSPSAGGGNFLLIDAGPDQTIVMGKDVPDQLDGQHTLSVRVLVEANHPGCAFFDSLAKIEVGTVRNNGWDKKFQLYFGSRTMRFNYGPTLRDAVGIVPQTRLGHWYSIRVDFNMNTDRADVWVDGALAARDVPMHPGPIVDLGLSGWDLRGYVQLDDLRGMRK